ncbi:MAG TPA: glycosyltransferase family 4 protein [Steroidobacteraceae bacterium]|nr:glycosyltransferase family 4 protein [Steroidobacteraceae bacterium]
MTARKILVLSTLQVFPPESGGQLRTAGLLGALAARGYEVTVYSMVGRKADYLARRPSGFTAIGERLREYVDRGRFWAAIQFLAYRLNLPPLWITAVLKWYRPSTLYRLLAECDAAIVDFPFMYPVALRSAKPVALNTHNVEASLCREGWIKRSIARVEREAARSVQQVFCCSESDRAHFATLTAPARTSIVPNGIDPSRFTGIAAERAALRASLGYRDNDRVLFFAASAYGPNVEAMAWLLEFIAGNQALLASRNLHFLIAGSVSRQLIARPHLRTVGMVARVEPYFAAADIGFNCVFRGSGTNVKMAEFIAAGLPIVTSTAGMRGYDVVDGEDCIAFTQDTLAAALANSALQDPARLNAMAKSAYEKNKRQIDMNWCIEPLVAWIEGVS